MLDNRPNHANWKEYKSKKYVFVICEKFLNAIQEFEFIIRLYYPKLLMQLQIPFCFVLINDNIINSHEYGKLFVFNGVIGDS